MRDKKEELHELPDIEFVKFELQEKTSLWRQKGLQRLRTFDR